MKLGYMAVGHRGTVHQLTDADKSPRAQLLAKCGRQHCARQFCDLKNGGTQHTGYIVAGEWWTIFGLEGVTFAREV